MRSKSAPRLKVRTRLHSALRKCRARSDAYPMRPSSSQDSKKRAPSRKPRRSNREVGDPGDHFEDDEALLQPHHFVTRACFHHFHVLRTRPAQMLEGNAPDSSE